MGKGKVASPVSWRILVVMAAVAMLLLVMAGQGGADIGSAADPHGEAHSEAATPGKAFSRWLPAALSGDASAQYELGRAYADQPASQADMAEAARWFQRAAELGSIRAQHDLAMLYTKGLGVPQDYVQSYVWFDLAAARLGAGRSHEQALEMRDMMAAFLTPAQLAEAKRLSAERQAKSN